MPTSIARRLAVAVLLSACLGPTACADGAHNVSVLQSDKTPPERGDRYAWAPANAATYRGDDPRISEDFLNSQIRTAIDVALFAKGYHRVANPETADLLVAYRVRLDTPQRNGRDAPGALILDLIDRPTGKLAWRATSTRRVGAGDANPETLSLIIEDMTKTLPAIYLQSR